MHSLKCVVVGSNDVGKTWLIKQYVKEELPPSYVPTIFESYLVSNIARIQGENYDLNLFDTAGNEESNQFRELSFKGAHIILVCFPVNDLLSIKRVREMWIPELRKNCPGVPYILVGTRIDLRNAQGEKFISKEQGENFAKELQAVKYMECSALKNENVNHVFQEAIMTALADCAPSLTLSTLRVPSVTIYDGNRRSKCDNKYRNSNCSDNNSSTTNSEDNSDNSGGVYVSHRNYVCCCLYNSHNCIIL